MGLRKFSPSELVQIAENFPYKQAKEDGSLIMDEMDNLLEQKQIEKEKNRQFAQKLAKREEIKEKDLIKGNYIDNQNRTQNEELYNNFNLNQTKGIRIIETFESSAKKVSYFDQVIKDAYKHMKNRGPHNKIKRFDVKSNATTNDHLVYL